MKMKVLSSEIKINALGQRLTFLEASIAVCVEGEHDSGVPGSESMADKLTVHIGTWENHLVPNMSFQQAEEARRKYDEMVVRLTHSRGVAGVMPGGACSSLEGAGSMLQRGKGT